MGSPLQPTENSIYTRRVRQTLQDWPILERTYQTYKPLRILVEGDSWVAYPQIAGTKNITLQLADNPKYNLIILCLAQSGDEAVSMMSSSTNKSGLLGALESYEFDVLLFSGGGNDIVGQYDFDFLLNKQTGTLDWEQCINQKRLTRRMMQIKNAYLDLIDYVDTYGKGDSKQKLKIVTHTYDYLPPSPKGFLPGRDSWLYPYFMAKKIENEVDQIKIIDEIMNIFVRTLQDVEKTSGGRFQVVDTRKTIGTDKQNWLNEIHPKSPGFKKIADKIYDSALKNLIKS